MSAGTRDIWRWAAALVGSTALGWVALRWLARHDDELLNEVQWLVILAWMFVLGGLLSAFEQFRSGRAQPKIGRETPTEPGGHSSIQMALRRAQATGVDPTLLRRVPGAVVRGQITSEQALLLLHAETHAAARIKGESTDLD